MADESGPSAIQGVLETSLYARDLGALQRFIPICSGSGRWSFPAARRFRGRRTQCPAGFQAGSTEQEVVDPRGTIRATTGPGACTSRSRSPPMISTPGAGASFNAAWRSSGSIAGRAVG